MRKVLKWSGIALGGIIGLVIVAAVVRKVLKWSGIAFRGVIGLVIVAAVVLLFIGGSRVNRSYNIQVETVAILSDAASL